MCKPSKINLNIKKAESYYYNSWECFKEEDSNLHSITLKCCNFANGEFDHSVLANSDWDSCKISDCSFSNLNFQGSDITSTYFNKSKFFNICFKGSTVTDVNFSNCEFINCDFNHISLNSTSFENCTFRKLKLRQSTTSLNEFISCKFVDTSICGNFFYNLFVDSDFQNSIITISLLSSNYGFTKTNLAQLNFSQNEIKDLQQTCLNNKDIVGAAIVSLNIEDENCDYSILTSIQVIVKQLENNILIRSEQLLFFKSIMQYLVTNKKMSLYNILYIINLLEKTKKFNCNIAIQKSMLLINQITNMLLDNYYKILNEIHNELPNLISQNKPISLKITYAERPQIPICSLIEELMEALGIHGPAPIRKKTAVGSFIEWIQGYDNILKCLQLLISILGLNIKLKKEKKTEEKSHKTETSNKVETSDTNTVVIQIPESVLKQLNVEQTEQDISKAINVFVLNGLTVNNNFQGYNSVNVKKIEIL